jgi:hypothetical protein
MGTVLHHSLPELPATTALDGTEYVIMTAGGITYKITIFDFLAGVIDLA